MKKEDCQVLPVFTNGKICVSCWKLTEEERAQVAETGILYIGVLTGMPTQPPVKIWGTDPFKIPFCEKCKQHHPFGIVIVICSSCGVPFNVDGCVYHEDNDLKQFTCPTCDELRKDLGDENW